MFNFQEIWCTLFSYKTCFEIYPFALLPTIILEEQPPSAQVLKKLLDVKKSPELDETLPENVIFICYF